MKKAQDDAAFYYTMIGHKNNLLPSIKSEKHLLYKNTDFLGN